jgi:hypothetical protein
MCHLILYFQSVILAFFRQIRRTETFNYIVDSTMDTEGASRDHKTSLMKLEATVIASTIKNCPTCAKEFTSAERLDCHRRAAACSTGGNSGAAYACWLESCERRFVQAAHLENHRLFHVDERRYACQACYARFAAPASLSLHLTQLHAQVSAFPHSSVPDPDPPGPHVFGPPGSGSFSQRYGSGSGSYHPSIIKQK